MVLPVVAGLVLTLASLDACMARAARNEAGARAAAARDRVAALRERIRTLEARSTSDDAFMSRAIAAEAAPPAGVLAEIAGLLPGGVRLDGFTVRYDRGVTVDLLVVARGARDYDLFLDRLSASSRFEAVQPGPESREGEIHASVRAAYRVRGGDQ